MEAGPAARILLVGDQEADPPVTARAMRGAGYEVVEAASAPEAIVYLKQQAIDLVVLDVSVPGNLGQQVLRHLKARPELALIPALYLSVARPEDEEAAAGLEAGADVYLTKPVPGRVLLAQVAALLRVRERHLELARAQEEAEGARHHLQEVLDALPAAVAIAHDPECQVVTLNPAGAVAFGVGPGCNVSYAAEEGVQPCRLFHAGVELTPDTMPLQMAIRQDRPVTDLALEVVTEGRRWWLRTSTAPLHDRRGGVSGAVAVSADITVLKEAEAALRESEERFRGLVESTSDWIWEVDAQCVYTYASPKVRELLGYEPSEVVGKTPFDFMPPEEAKRVAALVAKPFAEGRPLTNVVNHNLHRYGHLVALETNGVPLFDEAGRLRGYRGVDRDITERLRGEREQERLLGELERTARELEEQRSVLEAVLKHMPSGVIVVEAGTLRVLLRNEAFERIVRQPVSVGRDVVTELHWTRCHPDGREYHFTELPPVRALEHGEVVVGEEMVIAPSDAGAATTVLISAAPVRDAEGRVVAVVSVFHDITERTRAEGERERLLAAAEEKQRLLDAVMEYIPEGVTIARTRGLADVITSRYARQVLFGTGAEDRPDGDPLTQVTPLLADGVTPARPEDLPLWRAVHHGQTTQGQELVLCRPDGKLLPVLCSAGPIRDGEGKITGGIMAWRDITLRKQRQEALAHQARLLETMQESTPNSLAYVDGDLRVVRVNSSFAQLSGLPAREILGRLYPEVLPGHEEVVSWMRQVLATGEPISRQEYLHVPCRRPELGARCLDASYSPVQNEKGQVEGLVISVTDVTERVAQRERLLAAERARAEIAERLHDEIAHRVKNNLAMVSGLLSMQALSQSSPEVAAALRAAVTRVRTFATIHEQMYTQPGEQMDLLEAVRRLAATTLSVFSAGSEVDIAVEGERVVCSGRDVTNLCVIANELLTNALKHGAAGPDGKLRVQVQLAAPDERITLSVWNSGPPLPAGLDANLPAGMGLRLVTDLVGQYEGRFQLYEAAEGTRAEASIPKRRLT